MPEPDIVMVPGGGAPTLRQLANPVLLDYLRTADRTAEMVTSVCTGSLLLAGAGLLQGRPATIHWAYHRFLNRLGATDVPERWAEDGPLRAPDGNIYEFTQDPGVTRPE